MAADPDAAASGGPCPRLPPAPTRPTPIRRVGPNGDRPVLDTVAVEAPLEIRLATGPGEAQDGPDRGSVPLTLTMRTPGHDLDLAVGLLVAEGLLCTPDDLVDVRHCGPADRPHPATHTVAVHLAPHVQVDWHQLARRGPTTSACGVCGKTHLDAVASPHRQPAPRGRPALDGAVLRALPDALRGAQSVFEATGGNHAAALATPEGRIRWVAEDVGRHNAVDKVVGQAFVAGALPVHGHVLVVSGRASFELVDKALVAGAAALVAVGAPSSLAVDLARAHHLTLLGFTSARGFNVYAGADRIVGLTPGGGSASAPST